MDVISLVKGMLVFWFGAAFGFCVCALFAGRVKRR